MKIICLFFILLVPLAACSKRIPPPMAHHKSLVIEDVLPPIIPQDAQFIEEIPTEDREDMEEGAESKTIVIKRGDTIYALSQRYDSSVDELIALNNLTPPFAIFAGDELIVPNRGQAVMQNQELPAFHKIVKGDTLHGIARHYGVSFADLLIVNEMDRNQILRVGAQIRLPHEKTSERNLRAQDRFIFPVAEIIEPMNPSPSEGFYIATKRGAEVRAIKAGEVVYAGNEVEGYGNLLLIRHADGLLSTYGHNDELLVGEGDHVTQGQTIARAGTTGTTENAQLYFELRRDNKVIDPRPYLTAVP